MLGLFGSDTVIKKIRKAGLGWNPDTIKSCFDKNPPQRGDSVIVIDTRFNLYTYTFADVVEPCAGRQKQIILDLKSPSHGTAFYRTGKNCRSPKGQVSIVPFHHKMSGYLINAKDRTTGPITLEQVIEILG